jgi:hypothetical protein
MFFLCTPHKITRSVIPSVSVYVVNERLKVWIRAEQKGYPNMCHFSVIANRKSFVPKTLVLVFDIQAFIFYIS